MNDNNFGNKREISLPLRLKILFGASQIQAFYGFTCFFMIPIWGIMYKFKDITATKATKDIIILYTIIIFIILVLLFELKHSLKAIPLLETGQITYAKININKNKIISYEFEDKNGKKYNNIIKFHRRETLTEGSIKEVLYDLNNPKRNMIKDNLRIYLDLKENNQFKSPNLPEGLALLILPFIAFCMILTSIVFAILYL